MPHLFDTIRRSVTVDRCSAAIHVLGRPQSPNPPTASVVRDIGQRLLDGDDFVHCRLLL
jgi:hypothetical protein